MMTSLRIKGAIDAKRQDCGYIGRAPDGYIIVEDKQPHHKSYARRTHHIELCPERSPIWRLAWDLLLEDKLTLAEICEELHTHGYRYRSGRPFIEVKANGRRKANYNTMSHIFHNWAYAGWIVNEEEGILPKTLRGNWEALVSTPEFERGLAILKKCSMHQHDKRKHDYLLSSLIFLLADKKDLTKAGNKLYRLTGSTSNTHRSGGGTAHYRLERHPIHFLYYDMEKQLVDHLHLVQVDVEAILLIRDYYINEVAEIEHTLKQIDEEEARVLRVYAAGTLTEENWKDMWAEWQDKRNKLRANLALLDQKCDLNRTQLEPVFSRNTLEFTQSISFPQQDKLKRLSLQN